MANLLARLRARGNESRSHPSISWDDYQSQLGEFFTFGGTEYPILNQTLVQGDVEDPDPDFAGHLQLMRTVPPAFAAQMVRAMTLSQATFVFRNNNISPTPGRVFGTRALDLLERPWPNGTTGELLSRMEWHAGLEGNAFVARRPKRLRILRPDWVWIIWGSHTDPDNPMWQLDAELVGYRYQPGGLGVGEPEFLLPEEVAHWSPIPDPEAPGRGMSWFTPAVREALGDKVVTEHKRMYFKQGATPNLVVKGVLNSQGQIPTPAQFKEIVDTLEGQHAGYRKAYKTLYLTQGADATVVGSNLADLDLKNVQGAFETRIAYLSRVPAAVLNIAEGLQGSALNAGNFKPARRNFTDTWVFPTLADLAGALSTIVQVPNDAELWYRTEDMPILREDEKDAAEIAARDAQTIAGLVREGFTWESAKAAVIARDMDLLQHTGLLSVQLQPPGTSFTDAPSQPQRDRVLVDVPPGRLPPPPRQLPWRTDDRDDD